MMRFTINKTVGLVAATALVVGLTIPHLSVGAAKSLHLRIDDTQIDRDGTLAASYAPVVKATTRSVVNVYSESTVEVHQNIPEEWRNSPFFRRFFGDPDQMPRSEKAQAMGSGIIVTEDGYILTNNHVVENADKINVVLSDNKTSYTAEVVGTDPQTDVAVLKIDANDLPPIVIADSDHLEVGDVVFAIGNPMGVGQSVSMGIISALGRGFGILGYEGYEDFIQTDAAINMGNSGGALIDTKGRLIGINQSIMSRSGGNQGIGFAVPINLARDVMEAIVTKGKVSRGYLGVSIQSVTPELAEAFDLDKAEGALVGEVNKDTPAEKAGLKSGDVIVEFDGKPVPDHRKLRLMVSQQDPGTPVTVKVIRNGDEREFKLKLGELPSDLAQVQGSSGGLNRGGDALDGVELTDLSSEIRRQFNIPSRMEGAVVVNIDEDSNAFEAGLRPGDVIVEINRKSVESVNDANKLLSEAEGDKTLLRVWSRKGGFGGTSWMAIKNKKEDS